MSRPLYWLFVAGLLANAVALALAFHIWTIAAGRRARLFRNLSLSSAGLFLTISSALLGETNVIPRTIELVGALAGLVSTLYALVLISRDQLWRSE